jgi:hypothetical protein
LSKLLFVISSTAAGHVETHTYPNNSELHFKDNIPHKENRENVIFTDKTG